MLSRNISLRSILTAAMLIVSTSVFASGFALIEQSGSGLGNAFAGGSAAAEDASTIAYNPAGMSRLNGTQIVAGVAIIKPSMKFTDTGSTGAALQTAGGNGGDAGSLAAVPNASFVMEINPQTRFGLAFDVPFGLETSYDSTWIGRFQGLKSKVQVMNLNPSISYEINKAISVGFGLDYQYATGDLTSMVNYSALAGGALGANLEGQSTVTGSSTAWGYNLGGLFNVNPETRIGLAYRAKVKHTLDGSVTFENVPGPLAASVKNGDVTVPITMPDSLSMSVFHHPLDSQWDVMADATWTGWSVLQQLVVTRTNGSVLSTTQENWKNTWRLSAGANYHYNSQWKSRIGIAFDQTPTSDTDRTVRIPDSDRIMLAVGGQYVASKSSTIDFGYAHLFMKDASISQNKVASGAGVLIGNYSSSVDIITAQYAYNF